MEVQPRTLRLTLAYDGTDFVGFGLQRQGRTVQGELEAALAATLEEPVRVTPGGRTDSGVHARGQVISFHTTSRLPAEAIQRALNARLPEDVVVLEAGEAPPGFDARRCARRRHYEYRILRSRWRDPFWRRYAWHLPGDLDEVAMREASALLIGRHDFGCFATHLAEGPRPRSTERTVERAEWRREGDHLIFTVSADGFLRHMARAMVGSLVLVGQGRWSPLDLEAALRSGDRRLGGRTAPPQGLTLMRIDYD